MKLIICVVLTMLGLSDAQVQVYSVDGEIEYTMVTVTVEPYVNFDDVRDMKTWNVDHLSGLTPEERIPDRTIMVYAEYCISSIEVKNDRAFAKQFVQEIPNQGNPCTEFGITATQEIIRNVSCVSRKDGLYLVMQFLELCTDCAVETIYSTTVAFGPDGRILAKYRHSNLFNATAIDAYPTTEAVAFTTDFNVTFGLLTAFDLLVEHPAMDLLQAGVTEILLPYAWSGITPFLIPFDLIYGWHFSVRNDFRLNLAAACYKKSSLGYDSCGSLQWWEGAYYYHYSHYSGDSCSYGFPCIATATSTQNQTLEVAQTTATKDYLELHYHSYNMENFTGVLLNDTSLQLQTLEVCHNDLCCNLEYKFELVPKDFTYYQLAAFDGLMYDEAGRNAWTVQACTVVACLNENVTSCSNLNASYAFNTEFAYLKLSGIFRSPLMLPSARALDKYTSFIYDIYRERIDSRNYKVTLETSATFINETYPAAGLTAFSLHSHDLQHFEFASPDTDSADYVAHINAVNTMAMFVLAYLFK